MHSQAAPTLKPATMMKQQQKMMGVVSILKKTMIVKEIVLQKLTVLVSVVVILK